MPIQPTEHSTANDTLQIVEKSILTPSRLRFPSKINNAALFGSPKMSSDVEKKDYSSQKLVNNENAQPTNKIPVPKGQGVLPKAPRSTKPAVEPVKRGSLMKPTISSGGKTRSQSVAPQRRPSIGYTKPVVDQSRPQSAMSQRRTSISNSNVARAPPPKTTRPSSAMSMSGQSDTQEEEDNTIQNNPSVKKKRPAWDIKGRLGDMEDQYRQLKEETKSSNSHMQFLQEQLSTSSSRVSELEEFRKLLENRVQVKEQENISANETLNSMRMQLETSRNLHAEEIRNLNAKSSREIQDLQMSLESMQRYRDSLSSELKIATEEIVRLKGTISCQSANAISMESEQRSLKLRIEELEGTLRTRDTRIEQLEKELAGATLNVQQMESKVRSGETLRRKLHNEILELKGNIRVFCRVRPLLEGEIAGKPIEDVSALIRFDNEDDQKITLSQVQESATGAKKSMKDYPFNFDKVFQPDSKQSHIFEEISQLVQSALDGYNVCIFAYGQTGSGKTYTMEGPGKITEGDEGMGMIPRAVMQIFDTANELKEKGWEYSMKASFLEIYLDNIRDLLETGNGSNKKYEIKHTESVTTVTDLKIVPVKSIRELLNLLTTAGRNRAVGETQCNERSSRSHRSVFTLQITGTNHATEEKCEGILNLIDLAGSERLSSSGSTGDRLKETQAINRSLSSLAKVISSIANNDLHVPYRDNLLTYLLQNSLKGTSKTLMFVNVSPVAESFNETINSLRFATNVNNTQIGTAKKNVRSQLSE